MTAKGVARPWLAGRRRLIRSSLLRLRARGVLDGGVDIGNDVFMGNDAPGLHVVQAALDTRDDFEFARDIIADRFPGEKRRSIRFHRS